LNPDLARLALVVLLVASIFAVASTGTVAAEEPGIECQYEFDIMGNVYTLGQCERKNPSYDGQTNARYGATSLEDRISTDRTNLGNSIVATRTMAYRIAEAEFAREMANDSSKADAQTAANKAVTEFIVSELENKYITRSNSYVADVAQINSVAGADASFYSDSISGVGNKTIDIFPNTPGGKENVSISVLDGSGPDAWVPFSGSPGQNTIEYTFDSSDVNSVSYSSQIPEMQSDFNSVKAIRGEVVNEIDSFSNNVNSSQFDELNASDIPSPLTQATEFGQEYNDTGSSGYASALLASLGIADTDLGTTYHVELLDTGAHFNGTLYGDRADFPNATVTTNTTYDGANQTVFMIPDDGNKFDINSDYKVHGITTGDGTSLNSSEWSSYNRTSLDPDRSVQTLQEWINATQGLSDSGSGGGLFGGSTALGLGLGIVAILLFVGGRELFGGTVSNTMDRRSRRKRARMKENQKMRRTRYKEDRKDSRRGD
jgi:hypothetical protein